MYFFLQFRSILVTIRMPIASSTLLLKIIRNKMLWHIHASFDSYCTKYITFEQDVMAYTCIMIFLLINFSISMYPTDVSFTHDNANKYYLPDCTLSLLCFIFLKQYHVDLCITIGNN